MSISGLAAAKLVADNVIKSRSAPSMGVWRPPSNFFDSFNPDNLKLDVAAGGFGFVVEMSAPYCLQVFDLDLHPGAILLDGTLLNTLLASAADPFVSPLLNYLVAQKGMPTSWGVELDDFSPVSLQFQDPHQVVIVYDADITLLAPVVRPIGPSTMLGGLPIDPQGPISQPGFTGVAEPFLSGPAGGVRQVGGLGTMVAPSLQLESYVRSVSDPRASRSSPVAAAGIRSTGRVNLDPRNVLGSSLVPLSSVGTVRFSVTCPYTFEIDPDLRRVDVFAGLSKAAIAVVSSSPDATRLIAAGVLGPDAARLHAFCSVALVHLIPTVAPAGRSSALQTPDEFVTFDALAFHVTRPDKLRQAMAVAINFMEGCKGTVEDVEHFIGVEDYGIISTELVADEMFKFRWRIGGSFGNLPLAQSLQVQRNNHVEDAILHGYLALDSLDLVSIEVDPNSSESEFKLSGQSSVHVEYLQLGDGTKLYSPSADQPNFGAPEVYPWVFVTQMMLEPQYSSDPVLGAFERQAYVRAFQFIGRPFADIEDGTATADYVRTEAVTKQVYILGSMSRPFI